MAKVVGRAPASSSAGPATRKPTNWPVDTTTFSPAKARPVETSGIRLTNVSSPSTCSGPVAMPHSSQPTGIIHGWPASTPNTQHVA